MATPRDGTHERTVQDTCVDKDIESMVRECTQCKKVENEPPKVKRHPWAWPCKPMDRIHIDFAGPYHGRHLLLMVDAYSKWCEVEIKSSTTAESTINTLRSWFARYGLPNQLITDCGSQFISNEFKTFCRRNGINLMFSAPYHQSSNGQVERFVQVVRKGLEMNDLEKGNMQLRLNNYLFAYRCTPSTVTGKTPSELFIGRNLKSKLDLLKPDVQKFENKLTETVTRSFNVRDTVFIRNYNGKRKWVPGTIIKKIGKLIYDVRVNESVYRRHVDQIIRNDTNQVFSDVVDDITYEYGGDNCANNCSRPRRTGIVRDPYPRRERRPVDRYGMVVHAYGLSS